MPDHVDDTSAAPGPAPLLSAADGLVIEGTDGAPLSGGDTIAARLDHRIAMSFAVAGLVSRAAVTIDDMAPVATSFPTFVPMMRALGAPL